MFVAIPADLIISNTSCCNVANKAKSIFPKPVLRILPQFVFNTADVVNHVGHKRAPCCKFKSRAEGNKWLALSTGVAVNLKLALALTVFLHRLLDMRRSYCKGSAVANKESERKASVSVSSLFSGTVKAVSTASLGHVCCTTSSSKNNKHRTCERV